MGAPPPSKVVVGAVTRLSQSGFASRSFLGHSLRSIPRSMMPAVTVHTDNTPPHGVIGLSEAYNRFIEEIPAHEAAQTILVLAHDDVYIHDWFFPRRLEEGLKVFDVVGVAGNQKPDFRHPSWALAFDDQLNPCGWQDRSQLSGAVGHKTPKAPPVSDYGPSPAPCQLLDGLLLAFRVDTIKRAGVRFDPQFQFHAYDLDFCRSCLAAGLRLGTWPIAVTHKSGGAFGSASWKSAARRYLAKWSAETG